MKFKRPRGNYSKNPTLGFEKMYDANNLGSKQEVFTKEEFAAAGKTLMSEYGYSFREATETLENNRAFTPTQEARVSSFGRTLKEKFGVQLRDLKGRFVKLTKEDLKWDAKRGGYNYKDIYWIDVKNSPERIIIHKIQTGEARSYEWN